MLTQRSPEIYWVVSDQTNAGKTTIAAALVKELNAQGERAVGFKPVAGGTVSGLLDFMIDRYPASPSKLFGEDAWKLTLASPLTGMELVDLVGPAQLLNHPSWNTPILMRVGTTSLNNVEYFCTDHGAAIKDRPDLKEIISKTGLPFETATRIEHISIQRAAELASKKQKSAFNRLLDLGVDAIVCESAAGWLPIWPDCPAANHVVYVTGGMVNLFSNVDLGFSYRPDLPIRSVEEMTKVLSGNKSPKVTLPLYLVEKRHRDDVAQETMRNLMARARDPHTESKQQPALG